MTTPAVPDPDDLSAAEALRRSERRLRTLFDSIDEGYCLCEMVVDDAGEPVDYRFLEINPLFEEMTGLVDPVGRTALELVPGLEPVWIETYAAVGLGRRRHRFEQGSTAMGRWFDVSAVPVEPHGHFALVFKDKTAERLAQDALRESEKRFRDLAGQLPLLVWEHDTDGRQTWVNETFCTFFGVTPEQVADDRWKLLTHPDDGADYAEDFLAAVAERRPFHGEVRARRADGQWRWLESWGRPRTSADGAYLGHLGTSADVTDRRAAQQAVTENLRFITEVTALVPGVMYVYDLTSARTVFVNRPTGEVLGYTSAEVAALDDDFVTSALHPADAAAFEGHLREVAALPDGRSLTIEYRLRHRDGGWRWFSGRDVVLHRDGDGRATQVLGLASDISERKAAETALRETAAVDAYRALLADTLLPLVDPVDVQVEATRLLGEHLGASRVHYAEVDDQGGYGTVHTDHHPGLPGAVGHHRFDDYGSAVLAEFRAGRTVVVDDAATDPRLDDAARTAAAELGVGAYVLVPLAQLGRPVAALVVHDAGARAWTPQDLLLVAETAERTRAAVQQALEEREIRLQHARSQLLADVLHALEVDGTVEEQLQRLADVLVPRLADRVVVRPSAGEGGPIVESADLGPRGSGDPCPPGTSDRPGLSVPLALGGAGGAVLEVWRAADAPRPLDAGDAAFLGRLAERVEVVLASAHVRRQEHAVAVRLQRALLPDRLIRHPHLGIEARYAAGSELLEVGGDWYDTFSWPDGSIGVMVGDVVGHTLDSAAAMGRLRAATAALVAHVPPSPAAVLDALDVFARGPDGADFLTAVCVVVHPVTGCLTYSSAGHPPVLVLAPGRPPARLSEAQDRPMCLPPAPGGARVRPEAEITLAPDTLVVLYSDGLIERRTQSLSTGLARLEEVAGSLVSEPLDVVADRLVADMTEGSPSEDDVVVAVLRWCPPGARTG